MCSCCNNHTVHAGLVLFSANHNYGLRRYATRCRANPTWGYLPSYQPTVTIFGQRTSGSERNEHHGRNKGQIGDGPAIGRYCGGPCGAWPPWAGGRWVLTRRRGGGQVGCCDDSFMEWRKLLYEQRSALGLGLSTSKHDPFWSRHFATWQGPRLAAPLAPHRPLKAGHAVS